MKKTIAAVAVLSAFAGSALAADISLYGRIDSGLAYQKADVFGEKTDKFGVESGFVTGSRWGIKGTEDLGSFKVGFTLESGFTHDDGKSAQGSRLFGREAVVTVEGDFGKVYMGRIGSIVSDSGSLSVLGDTSAFGNAYGWASMKYTTAASMTRYDNVIGYASPKFGGLQVRAMYSGGGNTNENKADQDRYAAAGLSYASGPLTVHAVVDYTLYGNATTDFGSDLDDGINVVVGGNYKMDCATVYGKVAYFDNVKLNGDLGTIMADKDTLNALGEGGWAVKGYGLELGAKVPAFGGNILASIGYRDAEEVDYSNYTAKLYTVNVGYAYSFSKRTSVYGAVGYIQEDAEIGQLDDKAKGYQAAVGLIHKF
ncbi:MAG: porin [Duodenibacillus sp.]|nr:porin [Duodenibacillus sp.]